MHERSPISRYLPENRFVYVLIGVLAIVVGGIVFVKHRESEKKEIASAGVKTATELFSIDADQDGLKDWEELVLKTDPDNADTDGDGTLDGEERKAGRNPKASGPSDVLTPEQVLQEAKDKGQVSSEMDAIFLKMFTEAATLRKSGQWEHSSTSAMDALAKKELEAYGTKVVRLDAYTRSDIIISNDSSPAAIRAYGNAIGEIILKNDAPPGTEPDLLIIYKAVARSQGEAALKGLDPYIEYYRNVPEQISKVPVPAIAAKIHLDHINAMIGYGEYLVAMRSLAANPFAAQAAFNRYTEILGAYGSALNAMTALFKENRVAFSKEEGGRVLAPISTATHEYITNIYRQNGIPLGQKPPEKVPLTSLPL